VLTAVRRPLPPRRDRQDRALFPAAPPKASISEHFQPYKAVDDRVTWPSATGFPRKMVYDSFVTGLSQALYPAIGPPA
jgi:hypothetical protein